MSTETAMKLNSQLIREVSAFSIIHYSAGSFQRSSYIDQLVL